MSTGGIRGGAISDNVKKIIQKDKSSYGPWKAKITSILDAKDWWDIGCRKEVVPTIIAPMTVETAMVNRDDVTKSRAEQEEEK